MICLQEEKKLRNKNIPLIVKMDKEERDKKVIKIRERLKLEEKMRMYILKLEEEKIKMEILK